MDEKFNRRFLLDCEIVKAHCNSIVEKYIALFYEFENTVKQLLGRR